MPARITLEATHGAMAGKRFHFEDHDTFVLGRSSDCHASLRDDGAVSRHHFLLEANPPEACIRDLGSLNGTYVNGRKIGARQKGETPEQGAQRRYPEVDLKDGDQVRVGQTSLVVRLHTPAYCVHCSLEIPDRSKAQRLWLGDYYLCERCQAVFARQARQPAKPEPTRCSQCGKEVGGEIGAGAPGDYVCADCRAKAEKDPWRALAVLLEKARVKRNGEPRPAIEDYEIIQQVGLGGYGAVYQARRKADGALVAVKIMLARVAVREDARKRFQREMNVVKTLRHPKVVALLDQGSVGSVFYFVMEYCDAGSVADLMMRRRGKIPLAEAQGIMLQAADGLAHAHSLGIVHRDLKPGNILLQGSRAQRTAKVSDFGLAKNFEWAGLSGLTLTGVYAGTPEFMPHEQVLNYKYAKPVTDVWSLAATFYSMLTGHFPRETARGMDPLAVVLAGEVVPIRDRDRTLPKPLAKVLERALSRAPSARYSDAGKFRDALAKALR